MNRSAKLIEKKCCNRSVHDTFVRFAFWEQESKFFIFHIPFRLLDIITYYWLLVCLLCCKSFQFCTLKFLEKFLIENKLEDSNYIN